MDGNIQKKGGGGEAKKGKDGWMVIYKKQKNEMKTKEVSFTKGQTLHQRASFAQKSVRRLPRPLSLRQPGWQPHL